MHTKTGTDITHASALLKAGEVVAVPTETVYGLAANALNEEAVLRIFSAKKRPQFNPLIVHFKDAEAAFEMAAEIPPMAWKLAEAFWPGPLTILLPKKSQIPDLVTAGSSRVALRVPAHPVFQKLLSQLSFPLAAPSANLFGAISPTQAAHVAQSLAGRVPYILDGGPSEVGLESTIIGFSESGVPVLYRNGGIAREAIEAVLGTLVLMQNEPSEHPVAPGQLKSHYAPEKPLFFGPSLPDLLQKAGTSQVAIISFKEKFPGGVPQFVLSPKGDLNEAARNLFAALYWADAQPVEAILAIAVSKEGLGAAINDRLRRAAYMGYKS